MNGMGDAEISQQQAMNLNLKGILILLTELSNFDHFG